MATTFQHDGSMRRWLWTIRPIFTAWFLTMSNFGLPIFSQSEDAICIKKGRRYINRWLSESTLWISDILLYFESAAPYTGLSRKSRTNFCIFYPCKSYRRGKQNVWVIFKAQPRTQSLRYTFGGENMLNVPPLEVGHSTYFPCPNFWCQHSRLSFSEMG